MVFKIPWILTCLRLFLACQLLGGICSYSNIEKKDGLSSDQFKIVKSDGDSRPLLEKIENTEVTHTFVDTEPYVTHAINKGEFSMIIATTKQLILYCFDSPNKKVIQKKSINHKIKEARENFVLSLFFNERFYFITKHKMHIFEMKLTRKECEFEENIVNGGYKNSTYPDQYFGMWAGFTDLSTSNPWDKSVLVADNDQSSFDSEESIETNLHKQAVIAVVNLDREGSERTRSLNLTRRHRKFSMMRIINQGKSLALLYQKAVRCFDLDSLTQTAFEDFSLDGEDAEDFSIVAANYNKNASKLVLLGSNKKLYTIEDHNCQASRHNLDGNKQEYLTKKLEDFHFPTDGDIEKIRLLKTGIHYMAIQSKSRVWFLDTTNLESKLLGPYSPGDKNTMINRTNMLSNVLQTIRMDEKGLVQSLSLFSLSIPESNKEALLLCHPTCGRRCKYPLVPCYIYWQVVAILIICLALILLFLFCFEKGLQKCMKEKIEIKRRYANLDSFFAPADEKPRTQTQSTLPALSTFKATTLGPKISLEETETKTVSSEATS